MATRNNKKSGCGCLSILAVIGLTAGGIYYWRGELFGKNLTPIDAAEAVPQGALLTSYISTDAKDWSQLSKFGTLEAQQVLGKKLNQFKNNLSSQEINYEQDVYPWLGGVMLAFMPSKSSTEPQVLIVAGIKNKFKAFDFEKKLKNQPNYKTTQTKHQGITITTLTTPNSPPLSFAIMGSYVLLGDKPETVEQSIDTLNGSLSYSDKPGAKQILTQTLTLNHPVAQVYIADYGAVIEQGLKNALPDAPLAPNTLESLKQVDSIVVGLGLEDQGIHLQTVAKLNPSGFIPSLTVAPGKVLEQFPAKTFAVISGKALRDGWSNLVKQAQNDQYLQAWVDQVREGFRSWNLDADQEVFGWMDGEFALGMVFSHQSTVPMMGIGGMIILETSDQSTAQSTFNKIDQMVKMYDISVEPNSVNGIDVIDWKMPPQNFSLSRGWLNDHSLAMTLFMPFSTATDVKAKDSVALSPNFRAITNSLPKNNFGYFYLDLNQMVTEFTKVAQMQGMTPNPDTMTVLNSLEGLALTATMPDKTTSEFDLLLTFKSRQ
ncbi:DUF3352 domain-containing protein [Gloeothece verrucosa]|uniref:DUF3352 domain-containing protein n=1 Tax=Gloeothece verrucosa (strain PCC 7822) TaxID=497965 RepID=E0U9L4_GLOV7|nr:DUF3352 domain-containing protein [Gloeothece verrucosa]ADN13815.1 conserved hypothetical protein [Gloeothece verrucosa PCC 7822]